MLKTSLVFALFFPVYFLIKILKRAFYLIFFKYIYFLNNNYVVLKKYICIWMRNLSYSNNMFQNLEWFSNEFDEIKRSGVSSALQSLDNEAWTKGWPDYKGPQFLKNFMLKKFFWVKTWLSVHGLFVFKKLSIFITILFLLNYLLNKIEIKKKFFEI